MSLKQFFFLLFSVRYNNYGDIVIIIWYRLFFLWRKIAEPEFDAPGLWFSVAFFFYFIEKKFFSAKWILVCFAQRFFKSYKSLQRFRWRNFLLLLDRRKKIYFLLDEIFSIFENVPFYWNLCLDDTKIQWRTFFKTKIKFSKFLLNLQKKLFLQNY